MNNMHTIEGLGLTMPIISRLGSGWVVCEHKNGPCVCDEYSVATLGAWFRQQIAKMPKKDIQKFSTGLFDDAVRAVVAWAKDAKEPTNG